MMMKLIAKNKLDCLNPSLCCCAEVGLVAKLGDANWNDLPFPYIGVTQFLSTSAVCHASCRRKLTSQSAGPRISRSNQSSNPPAETNWHASLRALKLHRAKSISYLSFQLLSEDFPIGRCTPNWHVWAINFLGCLLTYSSEIMVQVPNLRDLASSSER